MSILNKTAYKFLSDFLLKNFHIDDFNISAMQGDAGFRSYYRVSVKEPAVASFKGMTNNYILMDCPTSYAPIKPFLKMADYINSTNLKAPIIYAYDESKGYVLLEDFGKISGRDFLESLIHDNPGTELDIERKIEEFYKVVIDILIKLQNKFDSGYKPEIELKYFSTELLIRELDVFLEWYLKLINQRSGKSYLDNNHASNEFINIWKGLLSEMPNISRSIVLRDYHVENMMMLKTDNISLSTIGLLDFQDSLIGSPVYDLVSLLEDARIDVSKQLSLKMIKYFAKQKSMNLDDAMKEYHILGVQRNLRILGVFARKALRDKDDRYLAYIPRIIQYIGYDLSLPGSDNMERLKIWLKNYTDIT